MCPCAVRLELSFRTEKCVAWIRIVLRDSVKLLQSSVKVLRGRKSVGGMSECVARKKSVLQGLSEGVAMTKTVF